MTLGLCTDGKIEGMVNIKMGIYRLKMIQIGAFQHGSGNIETLEMLTNPAAWHG